jgi:hypothetical protein
MAKVSIRSRIEIIEGAKYRAANADNAGARDRLDAFTVAYFRAGGETGRVTIKQLCDADKNGPNPYTETDKNHWYDGGQLVRQAKTLASGAPGRGKWEVHVSRDDATFTLAHDACELARSILADLRRTGLKTVEALRRAGLR